MAKKGVKKFFRIFWLSILGIIVIATFWFLYQKSKPKEVFYEIVSAEIKTLEKKSVATGKIEPRDEILIKPQINGIIEELYKEAGQKVKAGEIIAKVKVVPDMNSISSAETRVNLAKIDLDKSKIDYDRTKALFDKKVASQEEYEQATAVYKKIQEEYQAALDALEIVKTGISQRSKAYSTTLVRSTVDGLILNVPVKVGTSVIQSNTFNDGTTIASVANMSDMLFIGKIDETEIGHITAGMQMKLTIGALQDVKLDAVIEQISPKGTEENGAVMFEVKAAVKMPDSIFVRAGYSSNAEIITAKRDSVLAVPESTVEIIGDSCFVYQLITEKPQTFNKTPVKLGLSDGILVELLNADSAAFKKIRGNVVSSK
ncbi:MAG: efflux RND transporter periplasmic adaptor subunit [Bacteroidales bacterium]|jgi:HlyD family secretion protein|nr:efflux RND transporter periplasmic adaptor subunit [Bacteroidales bacterium]